MHFSVFPTMSQPAETNCAAKIRIKGGNAKHRREKNVRNRLLAPHSGSIRPQNKTTIIKFSHLIHRYSNKKSYLCIPI